MTMTTIPLGHPFRIPWGIAPGTRHVIAIEWPVDQTGTTWTATLHDSHTGAQVFAYTFEVDGVLTEHIATAEQTATLNPRSAYEVRIIRTSPGPDAVFSGPVIFPPHYVPQAA
jgi:hypothetical protein